MENLLLNIFIFAVSLTVLIYSANRFILSSETIGLKLGIPNFVIGVTIVALGTSLPELVSSIFSLYENQSEIVIGNILGSNITNILLVLGFTAVVSKGFIIRFDFKKIDLPFFIVAAIFVLVTCYDLRFTIIEAIIGLVILVCYLIITLKYGKDEHEPVEQLIEEDSTRLQYNFMTYVWLVLGGLGIYFGAKYNINSVIFISEFLHIPSSIIALTAIALGTSLPELFVSVAAIRNQNAEIAVGNVLGSNTFNSLAILGIPRLLGPLELPSHIWTSLLIMAFASVLFIVFIWSKKVSRLEGFIALAGYAVFLYLSTQI